MKKLYLLLFFTSILSFGQNVTITKIIETGCPSSSGFLKTVELYVDGTVDFSSEVVVNYMQNGGAWDPDAIDASALGSVTDDFVYLVRDISVMQSEFPSTTFDGTNTVVVSSSTNGDDGYQIVLNNVVVSQFGRTATDADDDNESDWNHNDAVASRNDMTPDLGTWDPSHWNITAEDDLDNHTACQGVGDSPNLETYFASLGGTFPLGSGSGWTPSGATCTTTLGNTGTTCITRTIGEANDTYTAMIDFSGANNGNTFTVNSTAGTVTGDDPTSSETGTIMVTDIPEGTNITVSVSDTGDGGVCDLTVDVSSPSCIPLSINEVLFDPPAGDDMGDANGDGTRDPLEDEFIEFYNTSGSTLDISGYKVYDATALSNGTPRHVFPASTVIPAGSFMVLFGGGTPTGDFGGSLVQVASDGELNLTNNGDVITVLTPTDEVALVYNSSDTGIDHGDDQSVTRDPDLTGDFVLHTTANGSLLFSPGVFSDGSTLSLSNETLTELRLYPNPNSSGYLNIESKDFDPITITAFDLLGKQVLNQEVHSNRLNISQLNSGIYILRISQNGNSINKKLIVE